MVKQLIILTFPATSKQFHQYWVTVPLCHLTTKAQGKLYTTIQKLLCMHKPHAKCNLHVILTKFAELGVILCIRGY